MRLLALDLRAYGPFTDVRLDFPEQPGLALVYGANEAGKLKDPLILRAGRQAPS